MHTCFVKSLSAIEPEAWDSLVGADEPFLRHAFLRALESSGSVGQGTGWLPMHLLVYDDDRQLVAAMPCYEKHDSYGEFIFDWGWADAALRAGLAYYPKLVAAVPFTPASGERVLCRSGQAKSALLPFIRQAMESKIQSEGYSGLHVLFCTDDERALLCQDAFCGRTSFQFHWSREPQWQSFDDFLTSLRAPSRKQVRKERARAASHGLRLSMRPGDSFSASECDMLYALYRQTVWEKGAQAYLTPAFFQEIRHSLAPLCQVAIAEGDEGIIAMALFFTAGRNLFGRYWGARAALDSLHFELCYYLPIEWALGHGIERFEAGAQGEHKLKRGLLPAPCFSAHRLAHPALHRAVAQFVRAEDEHVHATMQAYAAHTPYARHGAAEP